MKHGDFDQRTCKGCRKMITKQDSEGRSQAITASNSRRAVWLWLAWQTCSITCFLMCFLSEEECLYRVCLLCLRTCRWHVCTVSDWGTACWDNWGIQKRWQCLGVVIEIYLGTIALFMQKSKREFLGWQTLICLLLQITKSNVCCTRQSEWKPVTEMFKDHKGNFHHVFIST